MTVDNSKLGVIAKEIFPRPQILEDIESGKPRHTVYTSSEPRYLIFEKTMPRSVDNKIKIGSWNGQFVDTDS